MLVAAENPRINAGRAARTQKGMDHLVELAELLQAPVNGVGERINFPSRSCTCRQRGRESRFRFESGRRRRLRRRPAPQEREHLHGRTSSNP